MPGNRRHESSCCRLLPSQGTAWHHVESQAQWPVRGGGCYLISGGLGSLGILMAHWLSQQQPGNALVLLSRTGRGPEGALQAAAGPDSALVTIARCDIGLAEDSAHALTENVRLLTSCHRFLSESCPETEDSPCRLLSGRGEASCMRAGCWRMPSCLSRQPLGSGRSLRPR